MKQKQATGQMLPETGQDNEGLRSGPNESRIERLNAAEPMLVAVRSYEVEKVAAGDVGVDRPYLSKMCSGNKPTNLVHLMRIMMANRKAARAAAHVIAGWARMTVKPLAVEMQLEPGQARVLRHVRATLGEMWPSYRNKLAGQVFGCDGELLEAAIELDLKLGK